MKLKRIIIISKKCKHIIYKTLIAHQGQILELTNEIQIKYCPICKKEVNSIKIINDDEENALDHDLIVSKCPDFFGEYFNPEHYLIAKKELELKGAVIPKEIYFSKEQILNKYEKIGIIPDSNTINELLKPILPPLISLSNRIYKCFPENLSNKLKLIPIGQIKSIDPFTYIYTSGVDCSIPFIVVNNSVFNFIYDFTRTFLATIKLGNSIHEGLSTNTIPAELNHEQASDIIFNSCLYYYGLNLNRVKIPLHKEKGMIDTFFTPAQESFVLLHELAHALLNHENRIIDDNKNDINTKKGFYIYSQTAEFEADIWASNILLGNNNNIKSPIEIHLHEHLNNETKEYLRDIQPKLFAAPICYLINLRIFEQIIDFIIKKKGIITNEYKYNSYPTTLERIHQLEIQLINTSSIQAVELATQYFDWAEKIMAILRKKYYIKE